MTWIVDASVAIKWFVREDLHERALSLLDHVDRLQAPDLIAAEVANVAWKKCLRGEIGNDQARLIAAAMRHYVPVLQPSAELVEPALDAALALRHPLYDCLYLACAEAAGGILVTADEELCETVRDGDFAPLVRHLGDFDAASAAHG